jgi:hypothetical protein
VFCALGANSAMLLVRHLVNTRSGKWFRNWQDRLKKCLMAVAYRHKTLGGVLEVLSDILIFFGLRKVAL